MFWFLNRKGIVEKTPWMLTLLVWFWVLPELAIQLGWATAEVGRQPWIVWQQLRTADAISKVVPAWQIGTTLAIFVADLRTAVRRLVARRLRPDQEGAGPAGRQGRARRPRPPRRLREGGTMTTLGVLWFALVGVLLAGYALFDGFDLGLGTLYPFLAKNDDEKEIMRSSIGPVWDGNEVWLLTGGGAIFAAFPNVYATVFSGFYLALMLVLFALIFRAVSFEFYAHDPSWRRVWDWAFFLGSALPALLFGVAAGNIVRGVPLDKMGEFTGNFFTLLNPYALVLGVLGLVMFMWQGAAWLAVKSENALYDRAVKTRSLMAWVFVALVVVATAATFLLVPRAASQVMASPAGWLFLVLLLVSIVWGRFGSERQGSHGWYAASLAPVALIGLWAVVDLPAARAGDQRRRAVVDHRELGFVAAHAHGDDDHRCHRRAAGPVLLLPHLSDLRRQDTARRRRVLGLEASVRSHLLPTDAELRRA